MDINELVKAREWVQIFIEFSRGAAVRHYIVLRDAADLLLKIHQETGTVRVQREVLENIEWVEQIDTEMGDSTWECPYCNADRRDGNHAPNCKLAEVLK